MRRAKIGFIFQRFNLLPHSLRMGNIEIAHDISTLGAPEKRELDKPPPRPPDRKLGIKGRLDHRPNELSGGEQQRVANRPRLINRPAIVLADEPTAISTLKTPTPSSRCSANPAASSTKPS